MVCSFSPLKAALTASFSLFEKSKTGSPGACLQIDKACLAIILVFPFSKRVFKN
ncbi:unnamed protein product [Meloidogyne enterolobii]|uniref:Uncharacterized protein n=1 Tax=Meloidogyne enterolobii TaxID=390850 RepID=A0ACB0ZUS4_MELEN